MGLRLCPVVHYALDECVGRYLRNDFIAASVAPTSTTVMPQAKPSPGNDDDDSECGDEQLGLSPLKPHDDDEVGDEYPYNDEWQSEPGGDEYFM